MALESARRRESPRWLLRGEAGGDRWAPGSGIGEPRVAIEVSHAVDVERWFEEKRTEMRAAFEGAELDDEDERGSEEFLLGAWSAEPTPAEAHYTLHRDVLSREVFDEALLQSVALDASWEIPARLGFGGWNECPMPEAQCAIWRHWEKRYGAHIIGISRDVIEAVVEKPPETLEEAEALAWEQYLYCPDIVDQGTETIRALAEALWKSSSWYFWWD